MDEILLMFGRVLVAALIAGIATQIVKTFPLQKWKDTDYFSLIVWGLAIAFSFLIVWIFQRIGIILPGWEVLIVAGILTAGLSMLGYEGVDKIWQFVGGNRVGGNNIDINTISGGNVAIGDDSESRSG